MFLWVPSDALDPGERGSRFDPKWTEKRMSVKRHSHFPTQFVYA
jgi:hypothetical protein